MHKKPMYVNLMYSTELLKGTLQTIILKVLGDHKKMYGYEITQKVKELSQDKIQLTEGSLYPTLHKLEAEGLLVTEVVFIGKRKRKYYSLTNTGVSMMQQKVQEFTSFFETVGTILNPNLILSWS